MTKSCLQNNIIALFYFNNVLGTVLAELERRYTKTYFPL